MDIINGALFFKEGEAAAITNVFVDEAAVHEEIPLNPHMSNVLPDDARSVVRGLHGVITDTRLPESQREEATNQLMEIALTGLRSSVDDNARYRNLDRMTRSSVSAF